MLGFSDFGLVQITRKRSRPSLELLLTEPCTCCSGRGRIRSAAATALGLRREVKRRSSRFCGRRLRLRLHPETLQTIEAEQRQVLEELREDLALELQMEADPAIRRGGFELLEEDADSADPGQASPLRHGS